MCLGWRGTYLSLTEKAAFIYSVFPLSYEKITVASKTLEMRI